MTPRQKIDLLAEKIADAAARDDIALEERVEALKALTGYLAMVQKGRRKQDDDPSADGIDFEAFRLAATEGEDVRPESRSPPARAHTGRRERVRQLRVDTVGRGDA